MAKRNWLQEEPQPQEAQKKEKVTVVYYFLLASAVGFLMIVTSVIVFAMMGIISPGTFVAYSDMINGGYAVDESELQEYKDLLEWNAEKKQEKEQVLFDERAKVTEEQRKRIENKKLNNQNLQLKVDQDFARLDGIYKECNKIEQEIEERENILSQREKDFLEERKALSKVHYLETLRKMEPENVARLLSAFVPPAALNVEEPEKDKDIRYAAELWANLPKGIRAEVLNSQQLDEKLKDIFKKLLLK